MYEYPRFPCAVAELHELSAERAVELLTVRAERLEAEHALLIGALAYVADRGLPERFTLDLDYQATLLLAETRWLRTLAGRIVDGSVSWGAAAPPRGPGALPERPLSSSPYYDPSLYGPPEPSGYGPPETPAPAPPDNPAPGAPAPETPVPAYATAASTPSDPEEQP
ncbi:hypothetical protein SDC9_119829 [bioreactor metagenome]|uniref:Uncharacterized protein n=1 Tax=bioreactor metagenome TaxID=1076179 RepID=A0A645C8Y2_9ZZZZ